MDDVTDQNGAVEKEDEADVMDTVATVDPVKPDESDGTCSSMNETPFINRSRVKEFALDYCKRSSKVYVRTKMKRVSADFMFALNAAVKEWVRKRVDGQASVGMTLR